MELFRNGEILLADVDGVLLNSQERFNQVLKKENSVEEWHDYLTSINWDEFLHECEFIPHALEVFQELEELKILRGFITKIHSLEEGREKGYFLREHNFHVPLYLVPPDQRKSVIYVPNRKVILLDDKESNYEEWEEDGGKSILFNDKEMITEKRYVKSLLELLK